MTIILASAATLIISTIASQSTKLSQRSKYVDHLTDTKDDKIQFKDHPPVTRSIATSKYKSTHHNNYNYKGIHLMPLLSAKSALTQSLRFPALKPLASKIYKYSKQILSDELQYHLSNQQALPHSSISSSSSIDNLHHRRTSNSIEKLNVLESKLPKDNRKKYELSDSEQQTKKNEYVAKLPKKAEQEEAAASTKQPPTSGDFEINSGSKRTTDSVSDDEGTGSDKSSNKKKRHKIESAAAREEEDEIVNEPMTIHRKNRISRLDSDKDGNEDQVSSSSSTNNSSSSYDLTLANQRSLPISKASKTDAELKGLGKVGSRSATRLAAIALAPSMESIAMRIVSSAASKSGRSSAYLSSSNNGVRIGGPSTQSTSGSDSSPQSVLSALSSTILSTAMAQFLNSTSLNPTSSSTSTASSSSSTWPNKLAPLLNSLASLSGLNLEDSPLSLLPTSSSSFLSTDLATSSSSSQPVLYASSSSSSVGAKPHTPKQYSPTVLGVVNLARYVLCKYENI